MACTMLAERYIASSQSHHVGAILDQADGSTTIFHPVRIAGYMECQDHQRIGLALEQLLASLMSWIGMVFASVRRP